MLCNKACLLNLNMTHRWLVVIVAACTLTSGCHGTDKRVAAATSHYDAGKAQLVIDSLDEAERALAGRVTKPDQNIIRIDRGLAHLMNGRPELCEAELRSARSRIEYLRQKDLREETTSLLTDDRAVSWTGHNFERRMVDNILTLSSLMGNRQDAYAHAEIGMQKAADDSAGLQPDHTASEIAAVGHSRTSNPPPARLRANAFTAWLHGAVHSERAMEADLTDRSLKQVGYWTGQPDSMDSIATLGTRTQRGHGVLNVITFVDRVTGWDTELAEPTTAALLLADQLVTAAGDHSLPPTIAAVKIAKPTCACSGNPFRTTVRIADHPEFQTTSTALMDINEAAWDTWQHHRDDRIARAVARRIIKKSAVYAAKDHANVRKDSGVDLLLSAGGVAWEAMEKADTRHLNLLPARIELIQFELPQGSHEAFLTTSNQNKPNSPATSGQPVNVRIVDGTNTFVLCYRQGDRFTNVVLGQQ